MTHLPEGRSLLANKRPARRAPIHDGLVRIPQPALDLSWVPARGGAGRQDAWRRVLTQYSEATWQTPKVRGLSRIVQLRD